MALLCREPHHLVLDRRAVARAGRMDHAGIQGGAVDIVTDDLMRLRIGIGEPAGFLRDLYALRVRGKGEGNDPLISGLLLHFRKIDGAAINAGRRTGLEADEADPVIQKRLREVIRRHQPVGTGIRAHISVDTARLQVDAGAQDHCLCEVKRPGNSPYTDYFRTIIHRFCVCISIFCG